MVTDCILMQFLDGYRVFGHKLAHIGGLIFGTWGQAHTSEQPENITYQTVGVGIIHKSNISSFFFSSTELFMLAVLFYENEFSCSRHKVRQWTE